MNDTKTAAIPARSRKRFNAAERLELVHFGLEQGKSRRQMARELGCDEGTIRRDIKKLPLPEDRQAAIRKGDSAEKHLRQVRYEKTGIDDLAAKMKKKRLTRETKTGGDRDDILLRSCRSIENKRSLANDAVNDRRAIGWSRVSFVWLICTLRSRLGTPVKVNGDSSGKPNGIPLKANSRRSAATLAC